jgi:hypothetical protein
MLSGTGYPTGKKTRAGAGMGKNLYPHAGVGFLSGRVRVGGCRYETTLPDEFPPVAISRCTSSFITPCLCKSYIRKLHNFLSKNKLHNYYILESDKMRLICSYERKALFCG